MSDLKICRVCLRTEAKVYNYNKYQLKYYYEEVTALKVNDMDNLPQCFCFECATLLHKFHKFKEKCYIGQKTLKEMLWKGALNYENIYKLDLRSKNLQSQLEIVRIINDCLIEQVYNLKENVNIITQNENKGINERFSNNCLMKVKPEAAVTNICIDNGDDILNKDDGNHEQNNSSPVNFTRVGEEYNIKCEKESIKNMISKKEGEFKCPKGLKNWKLYNLTEEEALQEFRSRATDKKYLSANHKCTDCFRWFSKKSMLERHIRFRHSELEDGYECRFCRMRYKWKCDLRKHIQQHYTKYECLRCNLICMRENTVRLHEEYHSGVTRKCRYCGQEFRHMSTYYTHLRTHRSEHVCAACGASFVSDAGLHQHKKLKHVVDDIESPDDYEEVNTYCEKCGIHFETRKAYEEHLFHSAMHSEGHQKGEDIEVVMPMKVFNKSIKDKVINKLRTRKIPEDMFMPTPRNRRRKVGKRIKRKPTTCYQCGKHFETQAACMKHHHAEHPRTSFYPPAQRHICEICGASLAPSSVAVHLNIHTRETVHTCDTCGRQFHSSGGLKRHLVTHTGEKRYSCAHCDKKFTQSNSMKLHYRTFHLKEPYPKRNRRKNKEAQKSIDIEETTSDDESENSLPEPEIDPVPNRQPVIEPIPNAFPIAEEDMHYMRL